MQNRPENRGSAPSQQKNRGTRRRKRRSPLPAVLTVLVLAVGLIGGAAALIRQKEEAARPHIQESSQLAAREPSSLSGQEPAPGPESSQDPEEQEPASVQEPSGEAGQPPEPQGEGEEAPQETQPVDAAGDWRLVLVNAAHRLDGDYQVELAPIGNYQLDARIIEDTQAMLDAARADGYTLVLYSAYRPMERSRVLYTNKVNEYIAAGYSRADAEVEAAKWIAPPGTSEHNTGLAVDVISGDYFTKFNDLVHDFDTTEEFRWLYENCTRFGFILRYPKDKQEITGITYEPWHYRYVGREYAAEIMEQGLCLEEYLGGI